MPEVTTAEIVKITITPVVKITVYNRTYHFLIKFKNSLVIHDRNTKKISTMTVSLYLIKYDH